MATNVFDLFAKISIDTKEYEKGLGDAKSKFSGFADGIKNVASGIGGVLADVAKGATVAIGAAGTALTALTMQSLDIYANFEQLEGGTKLMFGDAADYIIQKSEEAYKTVQLSQNEYLQQVNGFAVGLKTALGGNEQAAAELADKIVQAEADIVAATGNTQEMVQNAFNGIMRSNYTMLDNLGLGIKPTKEGMEEVIKKVNEWNAANGKATSYVIDNLADVQSALVDYIEMQGMAGYASMEAGSTITGSIAGVKAAWQNFLSGNGNVKDFTDMLIPTVKNIRGKLDVIIPRLTEGLEILVDELSPHVPELIEETLPTIITGASSLLEGLSEHLPDLVTTTLPSLTQGVVSISVALVGALPKLITSLRESIPIVVQTIMSKKDELLKAGKEIVSAIIPTDTKGLTQIASKTTEFVGKIALEITNPKNLNTIFEKGFDIINSLVDGLLSEESITAFLEAAPKIIQNLADGITTFILGEDKDGSGGLVDAVRNIMDKFGDYFSKQENRQKLYDAAVDILTTLGQFLVDNVQVLLPFVVELAAALASAIITALSDALAGLLNSDYQLGEIGQYGNDLKDAWLKSGSKLSFSDWLSSGQPGAPSEYTNLGKGNGLSYDDEIAIKTKADNMRKSGMPDIAVNEYIKTATQRGYAARGAYFDRPTLLTNDMVGEHGDEVLLPLESNTQWMDKLAAKIGGGGNVQVETINVNVNVGEMSSDYSVKQMVRAMIPEISEQLSNLQVREYRGIGLPAMG